MRSIALLNNKGGVGKTTMAFNLGWVLAQAGFRVLMVDLDPQAGLTALAGALDGEPNSLVETRLMPLIEGREELQAGEPHLVHPNLGLLRASIALSVLDDELAPAWAEALAGNRRGSMLTRSLQALVDATARRWEADLVLIDLGSSLGPLNRAAALAASQLLIPVWLDRSAVWALQSLGPVLHRWRERWHAITAERAYQTMGYVITHPAARGISRHQATHAELSAAYHREILRAPAAPVGDRDPEQLGTLKAYPGLAAIAEAAHKPQFDLSPADGALGAHIAAARDLRLQYEALAARLLETAGLLDDDRFLQDVEQAINTALFQGPTPDALDVLSSHTRIDMVEGVEVESLAIRRGGLRVTGTASVGVELEWGGGSRRDGSEASWSFPMRFDLDLDSSHDAVEAVHGLEIDTSSFYE